MRDEDVDRESYECAVREKLATQAQLYLEVANKALEAAKRRNVRDSHRYYTDAHGLYEGALVAIGREEGSFSDELLSIFHGVLGHYDTPSCLLNETVEAYDLVHQERGQQDE